MGIAICDFKKEGYPAGGNVIVHGSSDTAVALVYLDEVVVAHASRTLKKRIRDAREIPVAQIEIPEVYAGTVSVVRGLEKWFHTGALELQSVGGGTWRRS